MSAEECAQECDANVECEAFSMRTLGQSDYICNLFNNTCTNDVQNMTVVLSDTILYTIKTRSCYCDEGDTRQNDCFVNDAERCENCIHNYDGYNHFCVANEWRDKFHILMNRDCNFENAVMVFEKEASPWDPYGVTLTVSECMEICNSHSNCDTIIRLINGSKCVGYSYVSLYFFFLFCLCVFS